MPTYEYECTACGHTFEAFQKITDKHLNKCPRCNNKVKRLISSGAGIIFKGSGNTCPKAKEGCNACQRD